MINYWGGNVSLICPYCEHYVSFPTPEELSQHIKDMNHIRDNYIESLVLLQKLANELGNKTGEV
jgi:hypothetical protein